MKEAGGDYNNAIDSLEYLIKEEKYWDPRRM